MRTSAKVAIATLCAAAVLAVPVFAGCSSQSYVTSIAKTGSEGGNDIYTVYYSDGSSTTFSVANNSSGGVSAEDLYAEYKAQTGEDITYEQFLEKYLTVSADQSAVVTNYCLQSSMKIYAQFVESTYGYNPREGLYKSSDYNIYTGAAVIYDMDESTDGYTYLVTNYHVVYDSSADTQLNGGKNTALYTYGYLYGSEGSPYAETQTDSYGNQTVVRVENGYTKYNYGDYAIPLEYVGGSIDNDIAVLRTRTSNIKAINPNACEVKIADSYHVGQTAIAIGNPEDGGISVTRGVISTVDENILLDIDGDNIGSYYRSMRIDTPMYQGNSGGGLFNISGELIGITNAGAGQEENINYAVPLEIVTGVANNIIYYANDNNDSTNGAYDITFGVNVTTSGSVYVYDSNKGYGEVVEDINVESVESNTIAAAMGVQSGDILKELVINGTSYTLNREYDISDLALTIRAGNVITFVVERGGEEVTLTDYTVTSGDLVAID